MRVLRAVVAAVAALLVAPSAYAAVPGAAAVNGLLRGIPQQGPWLGKQSAPLILVEYVDLGAAPQNRLWNVLELLFANQGGENEGWVTRSLLTSVVRSVPGLDLGRLKRDAASSGLAIASAASAAQAAKVLGTPYLEVGRSLRKLQPLRLRSLEARDLAAQLDALLR